MSKLKGINSLNARFNFDKNSNWGIDQKEFSNTMGDKVSVRGKYSNVYANPLLRIREDKLRSLKRALYNSYQSAVIVFDKDDRHFHFRCLINHDKLKVDYEDKILSIPYREVPVEYEGLKAQTSNFVDTGTKGLFLDQLGNPVLDEQTGQPITQYRVKPGDTFQWISGNEGYMPNSYWIIFLQYSQETAYFRGQIRKADDQIQIIPIAEDGTEQEPVIYHGWTTGPNEDQAIWNVKKGVVWNDLYYSKILYITKDQTTAAYFKRFDRVLINGQTWEVQGYNDNYGTSSKNAEGGMIRVALKETYTSTNQIIKKKQQSDREESVNNIIGPTQVRSYDIVTYQTTGDISTWQIDQNAPIVIKSQQDQKLKIEIKAVKNATSFNLTYGNKVLTIKVKPFK